AVAMAGAARDRLGATLATRAATRLAWRRARHPYLGLGAAECILERNLEVVAHVAAACRTPASTAAVAGELAEHLIEDVGKSRAEVEAGRAEASAGTVRLKGGMAEAVVRGTLLRVLEDVVSLVDVLEFLLGNLVTWIAIRMKLHGELAVGLLEVLRADAFCDTECFVKIAFGHVAPIRPLTHMHPPRQ